MTKAPTAERRLRQLPGRSAPLAGALLVLGGLSLSGCVTTSDVEALHRHIGDVEKKVDVVAKQTSSREDMARLNESVSKQVSVLLRSNADLGTRFDDLTQQLQSLAGKLEDANRRLTQLSQQLAETQARLDRSGGAPADGPGPGGAPVAPLAAGAAAAVPGGTVVPRGPSPSDLYTQATADYQRGQFDLARQGFEEYVDTYPKTDLSDDALYWTAECWMAQKKPREAITALDRLFKAYPQSDKAAAAHLKKGLAHLDLGEKAQAIVQFQFVVHEYPESDEAKSARQRLRSLGSDTR